MARTLLSLAAVLCFAGSAIPQVKGQLYDLDRDPGETKNLSGEHPEIVEELKALLERSKASGRSAPKR
jgi:hypothetical protein